ncbi:MAG: hypothetical protein PHT84_00215 [Candidatus Pacebacteria bacterium]|nr:hypothetical protein [Candidatus Paceibacterota bacterium]
MNDKIIELLELDIMDDYGKVEFTEESKNLIEEIAEECRKTELYKHFTEKEKEYAEGLTAEEVFRDMVCKIAAAPTKIHAIASAKLLIPIIDDKLKK